MKKSTEIALKNEMGYTEEAFQTCKNCFYSEESENPHLDRDWVWKCGYNQIGKFEISPNGRCNKIKVKK